MSALADRLQKTLTVSVERLQRHGATWSPKTLEEARIHVCGARDLPMFDPRSTSRLDDALKRLMANGVGKVAARDHVVLAYNLAQPHADLDGTSLLNSMQLLSPLLATWRKLLSQRGSYRQIWRGALLSLFRGAPTNSGFEATRRFLVDTLGVLRSAKFCPTWLEAMERHPRLLAEHAVDAYVMDWLEGRRQSIDELTDLVELPAQGWFWAGLIEAVLEACCGTSNDALFDERWPIAFSLIEDHPYCRDLVLSRALSRYAEKKLPIRRDDLLQISLDAWGSPQLGADVVGRWSNASENARSMVCGWLAEEDLEDFAAFCKGDDSVDERRLAYWLRFKKQIIFSRIVLGSAIHDAEDKLSREFIARKKGRLGVLRGTPHDNAIMLRIGRWWFVEFSKTGNACYPYREDFLPFNPADEYLDLNMDLKNKNAVARSGGERLNHMASVWEERFDRFLSDRGIWPDGVGKGSGRVEAGPVPANQTRQRTEAPVPTASSESTLEALGLGQPLLDALKPLSPKLVDNRRKGGALWIELAKTPDSALVRWLTRHGFRYASGRGFYKQ